MAMLTFWCLFLLLHGCIGVEAAITEGATNQEQLNERLLNIEALLKTSLQKNAEFEQKLGQFQNDNRQLKDDNRKLKASVESLEQTIGKTGRTDDLPEENETDRDLTGAIARDRTPDKRSLKTPRVLLTDVPSGSVAFTARVGGTVHTHPVVGKKIVYNEVITNVGSAYNSATGTFVAPISGVYAFSFVTMVEPGGKEYLMLVKEGQDIQQSLATGSTETRYESSTMVVTLEVRQGEQVWVAFVENPYWHGSGILHGHYSVFSGWLVNPIDQ